MIKYIKLYVLSILIIGMGSLMVSCEKDTIDLDPVDRVTDETAYDTPERCELAVVGVYDAAQGNGYSGGTENRGYPFGSASIQQSEMRGEDMTLSAVFYDFTFASSYNTSSANNCNMWFGCFSAINRANVVAEGIANAVEKGVITKDVGDQYIGECLFIRALCYHNLMIHFALPYGVDGNNNYGMPYYTVAHNTPERIEEGLKIGRSTVQETYAKILDDLNESERLLSEEPNIIRATKGAAISLKTRVYLHMKDWDSVITEAKKLAPQNNAPFTSMIGGYELESNPATPFTSYAQNKESIFSIGNSADDAPSVNGALAVMMSAREGGRAIIASSPILYNTSFWKANDARRKLLYYMESGQIYFCDKYQRPVERDEYAPIIRYAEVLLNYAEAALRLGDLNMALSLLNAVRNRSVQLDDVYALSDFGAAKDLLEALLWERRIEFMGEGRRWEDIHRLTVDPDFPSAGIPKKIEYKSITGKGAFIIDGEIEESWYHKTGFISYTDKRFVWPIPLDDILRNPTLKGQQNAGW
ncbi:MAG: RagB/SusD family nutrient uptake outer membrane protein [Tannerellaceae bacterium]